MNRNVDSRFATNPTSLDMERSTFDRSCSIKTSFNAGELIPFYVDEVLPGDTFNVKTSMVCRMQTLITPVMDNMYIDRYYFFVPNRLLWEHWKQFNGENTQSSWLPKAEYSVPQVTAPTGGWQIGTIADYMGIPTGVDNISVNALPFRAYALVYNEWFRDQNNSDPYTFFTTDANIAGNNADSSNLGALLGGGKPAKATKYFDYFTACLPAPQKGPDVSIPVASAGTFPVITRNELTLPLNESGVISSRPTLAVSSNTVNIRGTPVTQESGTWAMSGIPWTDASNSSFGIPLNLWADTEGYGASATINQLRMAFQIQRFYEKQARGGTRYIEVLKSHFGVTSPDSRLQRPEYLGGNRLPVNINQVIQQSGQGTSETPLGATGAMSLTADTNDDFTKSFVEHGYIIGLMVVRYDHTYQQGLARMWSRKNMFDFYWPTFANIGEMAVLNKEIYAQGSDVVGSTGKPVDDEVFGYQEAWADYRYRPNYVTGEMRSAAPQSLDVWHLADNYSSLPALSNSWILEDPSNVNRCLAVSSAVSNQFFADIYIRNNCTRVMPFYSIPGLIDHH